MTHSYTHDWHMRTEVKRADGTVLTITTTSDSDWHEEHIVNLWPQHKHILDVIIRTSDHVSSWVRITGDDGKSEVIPLYTKYQGLTV